MRTDSVGGKALLWTVLALFLLAAVPSAAANTSFGTADTIPESSPGQSYSGSLDVQERYIRVEGVYGDSVEVEYSVSCNTWWPAVDGCEGQLKIFDSSQTGQWEANFDSGSRSVTVYFGTSGSPNTGSNAPLQHFFVRIKDKDTSGDDGHDYTLHITRDTTGRDTDVDGFTDLEDDCDQTAGTSTEDRKGCIDTDGDGWSDAGDVFPGEPTQWADDDSDGFGDNIDGVDADRCPLTWGDSVEDRLGCPDRDNDGWSDPDVWGEWGPVWTIDDDADHFWEDATQWADEDRDGYGDNWADGAWNVSHTAMGVGMWVENATTPDFCPLDAGASHLDRMGCPDLDGDGWSDPDANWTWQFDGADAFPLDATQHSDRDQDGWGDNASGNLPDLFPDNPTQWADTDGDGYGDNNGPDDTQADNFTEDATQWADFDRDGYGDNASGNQPDSCVSRPGSSLHDRYGCPDWDGDGWSNPDLAWPAHPEGFADAFPGGPGAACGELCRTQWHDVDGDGFGDNQAEGAWQSDACIATPGSSTRDRWGCPDADGDGASDPNIALGWLPHPAGLADAFPADPTQWEDADGDGYGDEQTGFEGDRCRDTPGTSRGDRFGCTDTDGDGWSDQGDRFAHDATQWLDDDRDGYGDNPDGHQPDACPREPVSKGISVIDRFGCPDTDGDGYSDADDLWAASPDGSADAFPTNRVQWTDADGDGFGDNPIGRLRDDCPLRPGHSTIDVQGCPDGNRDGYSDDYGALRSQLALMGSNPASSLLTFAWPTLIFLLTLLTLRLMRRRDKGDAEFDQMLAEHGGELVA